MEQIKYTKGYKYQLSEEYSVYLGPEWTGPEIDTKFIYLSPRGVLTIRAGYAWDGPSGPTWDSKNSMRGSLVHDALYQLIREGYIPFHHWRIADGTLYQICREDGMSYFRAKYWEKSLRLAGGAAAKPKNKKKVITAP